MVLRVYFTKIFVVLIVQLAVFLPSAFAKTMFEGYYIIRSGNVPVGYYVQNYSYDEKTKSFTSTYYIKTNALGGNTIESLKAVATDKFEPISYQYTSKVGKKYKTIDAKFKGRNMTATVSDGKASNTVNKKLKKGTFLSTFLGYLILTKGFSKETKFTYSAIAEEEAEMFAGQAYVEDIFNYTGIETFRVANTFKNNKFISYVTSKGEVIATKSPLLQISSELVDKAFKATKGMQVDTKNLRLLFGRVPTGTKNQLTEFTSKKNAAKKVPLAPKQEETKKAQTKEEGSKTDK